MKKLLLLCVALACVSCGKDGRSIDRVKPADDFSGSVNSICIEGHVYYLWRPTNGLAPKLDDEGKPVKCD
jgi:hypothetical protein